MRRVNVVGEQAQEQLGGALAQAAGDGLVIYLRGDLGAGKTTLVRGALRGLGYDGAVVSPTYTLVECYELSSATLCHLDLYRLGDPEELAFIGARELFDGVASCWIEWPDRARGFLPDPDLELAIEGDHDTRQVELRPCNPRGEAVLERMQWAE